MSTETLAANVVIGLLTAGFLAYAGRLFQRRTVEEEARLAAGAYSIWWYGASVVILNQALRTLLALAGVRDIALYTALQHFGNFPLAAALGGLMYYILYLTTGRRGLVTPVAVVYTAYLAYLVWYTTRAGERRLEIGEWQARLPGAVEPTPVENLVFGVLLAAPVLLTVAMYGISIFRVKTTPQRYRLGMVLAGFFILFGAILLGFVLGWNEESWFPLVYELPALLLAILVVIAYKPPGWIRSRLEPPSKSSIR